MSINKNKCLEAELEHEIKQTDDRIRYINKEIRLLEEEKCALQKRKEECHKQLKQLMPSSTGGNKKDSIDDWNSSGFKWTQKANDTLRNIFKLNSFRPLQLETINVTLSKLDCIVVMPTGGGKSLCFQLPAVVDDGVTLVVSPLVSLMEDQLWILKSLNIRAETLNASSDKEHVKIIHNEMTNKLSDLKLLYVTPEKLAKSKMFMNKVEKMYEMGRFNRLVIDEVHCCSTYGHDFRPDYKFLGVMKNLFPNVAILGLTATATNDVINDIKKILRMPKCILFKSSFNRPNLYYEVREKPSNNEECMNEIAKLIKTKFSQQSGIVYCFSQRECEQVASELCSRGIKSDFYHAQMDANNRTRVHERWLKNQVHVIVATIAFGMGIDKNNCRFVIHHSLSKSLENFYQESGRAGRDGQIAHSFLFFRFADVFRQSSMVFTEQTGLINLYSIINYCIDYSTCRRALIAQHFDDDLWRNSGECNQMCDVCSSKNSNNFENVNCIKEANIVIEILEKNNAKEKEKRLTANKLAELVYADMNSKSKKNNFSNGLSQTEVEHLILHLLMKQYLKEDFHFTPYNTICYLVIGELGNLIKSQTRFEICLVKSLKRKLIQINDDDVIKIDDNHKNDSPKAINRNIKNNIDDNDDDLILLDYGTNDDDYVSLKKKIKK